MLIEDFGIDRNEESLTRSTTQASETDLKTENHLSWVASGEPQASGTLE